MNISFEGLKAKVCSPRETLISVVSYMGRCFCCCRGRNKTAEVAADTLPTTTEAAAPESSKKTRNTKNGHRQAVDPDSVAGRIIARRSKE